MRCYSRLLVTATALTVLAATASPAAAQFRPRMMPMMPGVVPPAASNPSRFFNPRSFYAPSTSSFYYPRAPYLYNPNSGGMYSSNYMPGMMYSSPYGSSYYPGMMYSSPYMSYPGYGSGYGSNYGGYGSNYSGYGYNTPPSGYAAKKKPEEEPNTVVVYDGFFKPAEITVTVGETVRWTNAGKHNHTVTSDTGRWDSGDIEAGGEFSQRFTEPGRYTYHCTHHRAEMRGLVIVRELTTK
jgi:plastocyanin